MEATDTPTSTPTQNKPQRLGDVLLRRQFITTEQLENALAFQRDKDNRKLLGEVLVELAYVDDEKLSQALAEAFGLPYVSLHTRLADRNVLESLPEEFIEQNRVLPLFLVHGKLTVAVADPANVFVIEEIERLSNATVQAVVATDKDISSTLQSVVPEANLFVIDDLVDDMAEDDLTLVEQNFTELTDVEGAAGESPVIKLVNYIIYTAVKEKASDIHIEPDDGHLRVRLRVDGSLYENLTPPYRMLPAIVSRIKIMSSLDISERRLPQDGGITVLMNKKPIDLRVSTLPGKFGEKVVMRVVDHSSGMIGLDQLGFSEKKITDWRNVINSPNGIVLVTGPTGSGKSTTLYSSLAEINKDDVNISTVEDPVEFNLKGVNQFQTNEKAGFTFASALRSLLRQDPDIVMVGEVRDQDTARIATQAALTGHLVLSTLHTNDAPSAITRLCNIGLEPYLLAASIRGVLAQRLLRKVCSGCKKMVEPDDRMKKILDYMARLPGNECNVDKIYAGAGCARCRQTGYKGRVGVYELFVPDDETLDAISRGVTLQEIRRLAVAGGMKTLLQDGLEKVAAGTTTLDEIWSVAAAF